MKKTIKIAHLYYDMMNLYGENGNIKALKRFISKQNVEVKVDELSLGDTIDFKKYDIYYLGSGSEANLELVMEDLRRYRDDIRESIEDGKMFLVTGNSLEIFGKKIKFQDGRVLHTLDIFGFNANETKTRLVSEVMYHFKEFGDSEGNRILGFKNCNANIVNNTDERPFGFEDNIRYKSFFGMAFFGPVLIRNPHYTDYLLDILFKSKNWEYKKDTSSIEYIAYRKFVENFVDNANLD